MASDHPCHDELVAAFWLHHRLGSGDRADRLAAAEHFWAWETVDGLMEQGGTEAVALIVELADAVAGDDAALCYLGAGAIESLLCDYGPPLPIVVGALDRAAEEFLSVRTAVRCVWWSEDVDKDLVERFSRFGNPL